MENILFIQNKNIDSSLKKVVDECLSLRHKVFNERLRWEVVSYNQREYDIFDNQNTWYAALRNKNNHVVGTWRALPTTGEYMLRNVFPDMTRGESVPEDVKIWEISRFAIDKTLRTKPSGNKMICLESRALINSFYEFSRQQNINQLVAVTSVAAERMMKSLNVPMRRLGDGKAIKIGDVLTTAVLIDIPAEYHSRDIGPKEANGYVSAPVRTKRVQVLKK